MVFKPDFIIEPLPFAQAYPVIRTQIVLTIITYIPGQGYLHAVRADLDILLWNLWPVIAEM
jgi:hypothetical protein